MQQEWEDHFGISDIEEFSFDGFETDIKFYFIKVVINNLLFTF